MHQTTLNILKALRIIKINLDCHMWIDLEGE
jgi:hypothetical protein